MSIGPFLGQVKKYIPKLFKKKYHAGIRNTKRKTKTLENVPVCIHEFLAWCHFLRENNFYIFFHSPKN